MPSTKLASLVRPQSTRLVCGSRRRPGWSDGEGRLDWTEGGRQEDGAAAAADTTASLYLRPNSLLQYDGNRLVCGSRGRRGCDGDVKLGIGRFLLGGIRNSCQLRRCSAALSVKRGPHHQNTSKIQGTLCLRGRGAEPFFSRVCSLLAETFTHSHLVV